MTFLFVYPVNMWNGFHRFVIITVLLLFVTCRDTCRTKERQPASLSTFILVRHAEKLSNADDAGLTESGIRRAARLQRFLADGPIHAVYASSFMRTLLTAEPVAYHHQLLIRTYDTNKLDSFAAMLLEQHRGQSVLIVGHSNTTPDLANLLVGQYLYTHFGDSDYDSMIIVTCLESGACSSRRFHLSQH